MHRSGSTRWNHIVFVLVPNVVVTDLHVRLISASNAPLRQYQCLCVVVVVDQSDVIYGSYAGISCVAARLHAMGESQSAR